MKDRLFRFVEDWTTGVKGEWEIYNLGPNQDIEGARVRIDIKVYMDQVGEVNKQAIIDSAMDSGAVDVDVRIILVRRKKLR